MYIYIVASQCMAYQQSEEQHHLAIYGEQVIDVVYIWLKFADSDAVKNSE